MRASDALLLARFADRETLGIDELDIVHSEKSEDVANIGRLGVARGMTSARLSSSINASECSITACCAALRSPGLARNAPERPASRWGIGSSARSRTMTCPSGFDRRQAAMKRSVRRLDWPPSEKMLDLICRRVFMAYLASSGILPSRPWCKSAKACWISPGVFMTKGP